MLNNLISRAQYKILRVSDNGAS